MDSRQDSHAPTNQLSCRVRKKLVQRTIEHPPETIPEHSPEVKNK